MISTRLNPRTRRLSSLAALALAAGLALNGCMEEQLAGSTSTGNTGKGVIAGRVVNSAGQGVANARVRVVATDHNPGPGSAAGEVADVVLTGADGAFRTDSLPDGRYNLLSDKGGLLAFHDSVAVSGGSGAEAGGDTLKAPGSVSGVLGLRPGHDGRTVFLILLGTTTFVVPRDSAGNFKLGPLAEGEYRLRVLSTLDAYQPMDTVITVRAGMDAMLPDTLRLAHQGPDRGELPLVGGVSLAYDTVRLAVSLRWARSADSRVAAYHVYRRQADSGYVRLTVTPLADTVFGEDWMVGITPGSTYHYAVTALDSLGNEGRKGSPAVLAMTARFRKEDLVGPWLQAGFGQVDIAPDGARWMADYETNEVVRYGASGEVSRFRDTIAFPYGAWQIALDSAGDIYTTSSTMIANPTSMLLGKYSPTGVRQWQLQLPVPPNSSFSLYRDGEAVSLWEATSRTLVVFGRDGRILSRDTLKVADDAMAGYRPGIGFYTQVSPIVAEDSLRIVFRDRNGHVVSAWSPAQGLGLIDMERDGAGRWHLLLYGCVQVFSPERKLLGIVPVENGSGRMLWRSGAMYLHDVNMRRLIRFQPGS